MWRCEGEDHETRQTQSGGNAWGRRVSSGAQRGELADVEGEGGGDEKTADETLDRPQPVAAAKREVAREAGVGELVRIAERADELIRPVAGDGPELVDGGVSHARDYAASPGGVG